MEYRQLGGSGLRVPVLSFGTATFGGGERHGSWGTTQVDEARRMVDLALDAGINFFDTADVYSGGPSEEILGQAVAGPPRQGADRTKANVRTGAGPNDVGSFALPPDARAARRACAASAPTTSTSTTPRLRRAHAGRGDAERARRPRRRGKVRYIGCSNFSGWQLMKSLSVSERYGWARYVAHQALLLARLPRIRVGADAARARPGSRNRGLEPARRGASAASSGAAARTRRTAGSRVPGETEASAIDETLYRTIDALDELRGRDRQDDPAARAELGAERPDGVIDHLRRAQRGTVHRESRRGRLVARRRSDGTARRRERDPPIYPYWHQVVNNSERLPFPTSVKVESES